MGVAPQCTAVLEFSVTDRSLGSEVAAISANLAVAGGRVDTQLVGLARVDIFGPGEVTIIRNLIGPARLDRVNF